MPLYNNADTIRRALDSLLRQSFRSFRLVISDDASLDRTPQICAQYAERDPRIELVRQPRNLNYGNFRYVLQQASTPFFMFAAGDDYWHPDYAARMVEALEHEATAVCAVSQVRFFQVDAIIDRDAGTKPLRGSPAANIVAFLGDPAANTRMYGVFRTDVAKRAFPARDFHAFDWAFIVGTLREGIHLEVPEILLWRDSTDPARYIEYVRRDARSVWARLFPMLPLTRDVIGRLEIPMTFPLFRQLVWLNAFFHLQYLRRYHPAAAPTVERAIFRAARIAGAVRRRIA
jgi:glycosyltransferase involved in cell wall biosynthesis